jgi:hypothetical protein
MSNQMVAAGIIKKKKKEKATTKMGGGNPSAQDIIALEIVHTLSFTRTQ